MKIIKYLETGLDIDDTNNIYCSNYNNMLMDLLKKKFNGRCFASVYILNILEIVKRGNLCCKSKTLDGGVHIDIQFKAECLIYEKGEIIQNCKIIQISDKDIILAKSEFCAVKIKNITKLDIFKENDEIPVIVNATRYNLFDTEISVSSIPLVPVVHDKTKFKLIDNDFEENKDELLEIEKLEKKIKEFNTKAVKFFTDLIYPHKKYHDYKKIGIPHKIKEFNKLSEGDILFIGDKYLNEDIFYKSIETEPADLEISKQELYNKFLIEYKKDLNNLIGFLENYNIDKIKNNSTLWKVYSSLKN